MAFLDGQSMLKKTIEWDLARARAKLIELMEPGVLGFYNSVEITEILGFEGKKIFNVLTVAVAETAEAPSEIDWNAIRLNQDRLKLPKVSCSFGVMRYRLSASDFLQRVTECELSGHWKTSNADITFGALASTPPQFIPPDADQPHPWNGILKNNFFEGSHTLELFDTTKEHLRFLLDDSRRLTQLAKVVGQIVPIKLDGMSDRLGNIIIQLPVTVFSTVVRNSPGGEHRLGIAWHPDVTPRKVQITAEILDDAALSSFDSAVITTGEATLELNARGGGGRIRIWDMEKRVLLGATPAMRFFTSVRMSMRIAGEGASAKNRKFRFTNFAGNECEKTIFLKEPSEPGQLIGSPPERPREPWVAQRVFSDSISSLRARKEFVQYGLDADPNPPQAPVTATDVQAADTGQEGPPVDAQPKLKRKAAALEDLHELMRQHGNEGVWLWDPYLTADDVLRTLFYCPHDGVRLLALTSGKTISDSTKTREDQEPIDERERRRQAREKAKRVKRLQAEKLESAKGNCLGLELEFRIREGGAGWAFHDRFIIFPRAQGSALAWSLGTSINSFGAEHHILQKVTHGEAIAQAFQDLWGQLQGEKYLIWKSVPDTERAV
ncbi:hypothetical protein CJF39_09550 [Pseudomonas lundensis]|uniref:Uncharacterized protein n=1 Tax=Pseudomonas lundensis TaxID=86185 RepID=A0A266NBB2_9PSED|nr:VPA1262 family N-terminal domain-containing protein [Pseudomonas lundensis]OZY59781.1 hypothetical protein CJF39_09550 [Pseudomonas lundensis]